VREREPDPRNDHRPRLDAAVAVYALLERFALEDVLAVHHALLRALAFDRHLPRLRLEVARVLLRPVLVGAEFVVVVVARDVFPRVDLLVRVAQRAQIGRAHVWTPVTL